MMPGMDFPERDCGWVLSPSRTGTVFLTDALRSRFPQVRFEHEPAPARWELMLGNARNDVGLGKALVRRLFRRARRKRLAQLPPGGKYIEINPMLCPITDLLADVPQPLRVVHMVRDPRTWTPSILSFKASGIRRHVIDLIPFAKPYPSPRPPGWRSLSETERALWRWRFCNEQILQLRPACAQYTLVRYEDLFSADRALQERTLTTLLAGLDLDAGGDLAWFQTNQRINASPRAAHDLAPAEPQVQAICGPLLEDFGYAAPATRETESHRNLSQPK